MKNNIYKKLLLSMTGAITGCMLFGTTAFGAVVVLDPGHGGAGTAGAGAIYAPFMEKVLTLDVANKVKSELEAAGVTVKLTRSSDVEMSLPNRAIFAKSAGADLFISLHFNASGPHDKTGTEVWTSSFGQFFTTGYHLGKSILTELSALGLQSKGVKTKLGSQGDYYGVIRYGTGLGIPSIIVEHCFLDHPYDRSILSSKGTAAFAHADATGILNYLKSTGASLGGGAAAAETPAETPAAETPAETPEAETPAETPAAETPATEAPAAETPDAKAAETSAGAAVSKTKYGSPVDAAGNVTYTDAGGTSITFTAADWQWLLSNWSYTGDAEYQLHTLPAADLKTLLDNHKAGKI